MENNSSRYVTVAVTAIVASLVTAGTGYVFWIQSYPAVNQPVPAQSVTQVTTSQIENTPSQQLAEKSDITMDLRGIQTFYGSGVSSVYQLIDNWKDGRPDQALVRQDRKNGEEKVIYASVRTSLPELEAGTLLRHVADLDGNVVILEGYVPESDAPSGPLYSMDLTTYQLKKMKVNEVHGDHFLLGDKMAVISQSYSYADKEPGKLYLFDLKNDSYRLLATLAPNESFYGGEDLGSASSVEWLSDSKIRFAVFDKAKALKVEDYTNMYKDALIEYREVAVK